MSEDSDDSLDDYLEERIDPASPEAVSASEAMHERQVHSTFSLRVPDTVARNETAFTLELRCRLPLIPLPLQLPSLAIA